MAESAHCQLTVAFRSIAKLLSSWRLGSREKRVQEKCALQGHTPISTDSPHTEHGCGPSLQHRNLWTVSYPSQTRAWPAPSTDFSPGEGQRRCHTRSEQRRVCAFVQKSAFNSNVWDKHTGLRQEVHTHTHTPFAIAEQLQRGQPPLWSRVRAGMQVLALLESPRTQRDSNFLFLFGTFRWNSES